MFDKLEKLEARYRELELQLADASVISDQSQYQKLAKEYAGLGALVETLRLYREVKAQSDELTHLLKEKHDKDFEELAAAELVDLKEKEEELFKKLKDIANPKKEEKDHDVIIEIPAGPGGGEAARC